MNSGFWSQKMHADGWCAQVGEEGDFFQQRILKPFVLGSIATRPRDFYGMPFCFPRLHRTALNCPVAEDISIDTFRRMVTSGAFVEPAKIAAETKGEDATKQITGKTAKNAKKKKIRDAAIGDAEEAASAALDLRDCLVVDLGCGEGFMSRFLAGFGATCVGFDGSEHLISEAVNRAHTVDGNLQFMHCDIGEEHFDLQSSLAGIDSKDWPEKFDRIVVLMLNVLDHIKTPAHLLHQVAALTQPYQEKATVVASTLNPFFFTERGPFDRTGAQPRSFKFPWVDESDDEQSQTPYYPRDWLAYETMFFQNDLDSGYVFNSDLEFAARLNDDNGIVEAEYPDFLPVNGKWPRAQGPFVLWRLCPPPRRCSVEDDRLADILHIITQDGKFSGPTTDALANAVDDLQLIRYEPNTIVAAPGERCRGVCFVYKGSFNVKLGPANSQKLEVGHIYGDLECTTDPYSGRYLYEIECGDEVGKCLMIPAHLVESLIGEPDGKNSDATRERSLGDLLFARMRWSFNTFTPTYHRSEHGRKGNHPDANVKDKLGSLQTQGFEHFIRSMLTLVSIEETRHKGADVDLVLLLDETLMRTWLRPDWTGTEATFEKYLRRLHDLGIVDFYPVIKLMKSGNKVTKDALIEMNKRTIDACIETLLPNLLPGGFSNKEHKNEFVGLLRENFKHILLKNRNALYTTTQNDRRDEIVVKKDVKIDLTDTCTRILGQIQSQLGIESHIAKQLLDRFLGNVIFFHWAFFSRHPTYFIVIRDLPFLRRAASGGERWLSELVARMEMHPDTSRIRESNREFLLRYAREERFADYLEHLYAFIVRQWTLGNDLDFCGPHRLGRSTSWQGKVTFT